MRGEAAFGTVAREGDRLLWIVSSGGHLVQALRIEAIIGRNAESHWITNEVPQARSLLAGRSADFLPYVASRDLRGAARAAAVALRVAKRLRPDAVVSTGAAIAGVALPVLRARGYRAVFIESLARRHGHSLTGRIAALAPGVHTCTQYAAAADRRWRYDGTALTSWRASTTGPAAERPLRIFVTLGTIKPYRFDRAVDAVLRLLGPDDEVAWQLGVTERAGLPGETFEAAGHGEILRRIHWADVVITHAGVGSILDTLGAGKSPVIAVRGHAFGEHVDDHQIDIAEETSAAGLGAVLDLDAPDRSVLLHAAATRITES